MVARSGASPPATAARCVRVTARPRSTLARSSSSRRPSVRASATRSSRSRSRRASRQPPAATTATSATRRASSIALDHTVDTFAAPCCREARCAPSWFASRATSASSSWAPRLGHLAPGETALVHGGGGGVGTAAIRLLREAGHRVIVTAGSEAKCRRCLELGATAAIDYRTEDFAARARELTGGRGVDVVLDHIGARYLAANLAALAPGGRLVEIGLMGGAVAELNLAQVLLRRLAVIGSTLRSRSNEDKAAIVEGFRARFGTALARGALRPVVDRVLPLEQAAEAHRLMQASEHFGKIVLRVA